VWAGDPGGIHCLDDRRYWGPRSVSGLKKEIWGGFGFLGDSRGRGNIGSILLRIFHSSIGIQVKAEKQLQGFELMDRELDREWTEECD
jgi:hypothetical protein